MGIFAKGTSLEFYLPQVVSVVMLCVGEIQNSDPKCLIAELETTEIVIAMPVTNTNLFAITAVIAITGGYLEKAHFSFTLSFCSLLVLGLRQESLGIWPENNLI